MMTKSNASDDGYYCVDGFIEEDDDDDDEGGDSSDGDGKRQSKSIDSSIVSQTTCTQCQQQK